MARYRPTTVRGSRNTVSNDDRRGFSIDGLKEIQQKLGNVMDAATARDVKQLYLDAGEIVGDQMRANAPYNPDRKKGTHLKDAIFVDIGNEEPNVLVGVRIGPNYPNAAPHAWVQEFGSTQNKASGFMRRAIATAGPAAAEKIQDGLLTIIEKKASGK